MKMQEAFKKKSGHMPVWCVINYFLISIHVGTVKYVPCSGYYWRNPICSVFWRFLAIKQIIVEILSYIEILLSLVKTLAELDEKVAELDKSLGE